MYCAGIVWTDFNGLIIEHGFSLLLLIINFFFNKIFSWREKFKGGVDSRAPIVSMKPCCACMTEHVCVCMCACVRARVHVCVRMCVCVHVCYVL